jgi:ABC-type multidrug transport system fused ATPase/permease subunit
MGGLCGRVGEGDGAAEGVAGLGLAAELGEKRPAQTVQAEIAAERPLERLDQGERGRAADLRDGDRAVEGDDRRGLHLLERGVEALDPGPVGRGGALRMQRGDGALHAHAARRWRPAPGRGRGRRWRIAFSTSARPSAIIVPSNASDLVVTRGEIEFDRVAFHYGRTGGVIGDLSLKVQPGERIGIVGRSGAGKSTLVNLLLRFHDIEGGRITIDGQDVAAVTQESLRRAIAVVTQDTALLHRSIRDNVAYGRPEASEAEVVAALERAQAWDFVRDLVDAAGRRGLDAHAGERGVKLSGGQRQRIAIARALLKDAPILVLDEATSALDSEVEAAIQEQLAGLMAGKTVLAIAHRLSTIAALDRLVVMDEGRIVEEGSHDALLRRGGLYADLWQRQSGGFLCSEPEDDAVAAVSAVVR